MQDNTSSKANDLIRCSPDLAFFYQEETRTIARIVWTIGFFYATVPHLSTTVVGVFVEKLGQEFMVALSKHSFFFQVPHVEMPHELQILLPSVHEESSLPERETFDKHIKKQPTVWRPIVRWPTRDLGIFYNDLWNPFFWVNMTYIGWKLLEMSC